MRIDENMKILEKNIDEKEYLKNGLKILARIIIRKYIDENNEKDGENENERKSISNR